MSNEYTFPFSTCEKKTDDGVFAQPYSAIANIIPCFIILYFLLKTENVHSFLLLLAIFAFEAFHAFSHMMHITGKVQTIVTHFLAYCINFAFLLFFYKFSKKLPSIWFILFYAFLIFFDIYAFFNMNVVYYIFSQALLFLSVLFYYYSFLNKTVKDQVNILCFLVILIILLFLNEIYNCKNMLGFYPEFPYHIMIELAGMYVFYVICSNFYKL